MTEPARANPEAPDAELVARWRAGEEGAATALVARHAPALARYAASHGIRSDVEELVQDTFVRAFASLDGFRGESSLLTWLITIERRLILDRRRSEARRRDEREAHEAELATGYDALDGIIAVETERRLQQVVGRLTATQREVFLLRVTEGLSYKEIAGIVGTTEGAARVHYHNAMRAVKEALDD